MNNIIPMGDLELPAEYSGSTLQRLVRLPPVIQSIEDVRRKVAERLLIASSTKPLLGVDVDSENGTFVEEGIEERLKQGRDNVQRIVFDLDGLVILSDDRGRTHIGNILIADRGDWYAEGLPLPTVPSARTIFTPYSRDYINPKSISDDSRPAFILDSREEIAAQALMLVQGVHYHYRRIQELSNHCTSSDDDDTAKSLQVAHSHLFIRKMLNFASILSNNLEAIDSETL